MQTALPTADIFEDPPSFQRKALRKRVLLRATIVADETTWSDCTIRDISPFGAGAMLPANGLVMPTRVFLVLIRDQIVHEAEVRWQSRRNLGLLFHRTFSLQQDLPAELQFLKTLSGEPTVGPKTNT